MIAKAVALATAAYLLLAHSRVEAPSARLEIALPLEAPPVFTGGSPVRPPVLPAARSCADGAGGLDKHHLPGQVNGELVEGAEGLRKLRSEWGDALIFLRGGRFDRADLRGARLHNICFVGTSFVGSDWRGALAPSIGFFWSDLSGSNLGGAKMPGIVFRTPKLEGADARGADFSGGTVSGNEFGGWDGLRLDSANLRGFGFNCRPIGGESCGRWGKVSFRGADLREAEVDGFFGEADWSDALFAGTRVRLAQLPELGAIRVAGNLVVYEDPATVTLSPAEYRWLRAHIGPREEVLPVEPQRRAAWMRPGAEALFVAPRIGFDAAAQESALYRRLMPAIVAGAISYARVKVNRDGGVEAAGSALGGNGHMCGLGATGLLRGEDGWYSAWAEPFDPPSPPPSAPVPVLRFSGDRVEVFEGGHPEEKVQRDGFGRFVTCGARAGFEEMVRVPFPPASAHRLWYQAGRDAGD
ncbi:MAG TPA: pentapeptide repeat-containing protein [Allosphingosinicella sp.]